jgi:hypothetical protein
MVVAHAAPSEVQSTVGSDWRLSPLVSGRVVWLQVAPPSSEKNCAWLESPMAFEAAMILLGSLKFSRISDSLRGLACAPDIRRFAPTALFRDAAGGDGAASSAIGVAAVGCAIGGAAGAFAAIAGAGGSSPIGGAGVACGTGGAAVGCGGGGLFGGWSRSVSGPSGPASRRGGSSAPWGSRRSDHRHGNPTRDAACVNRPATMVATRFGRLSVSLDVNPSVCDIFHRLFCSMHDISGRAVQADDEADQAGRARHNRGK